MGVGILMGLLASASWAAANVFIQRAGRTLGPFRALVWAQAAGGLALVPFAWWLDHRAGAVPLALVGWLVIAAVAAVVAYASMFYAMERGRLSTVVPVMTSWSVIAAAISIAVLHQTVRRSQLAGAATVVVGVLIVARFSQTDGGDAAGGAPSHATGTFGSRTRRALGASVCTALGFGVLIPAIDRLAPALGALGTIPCVFLADLLLGLPLALLAGVNLRPPSSGQWPAVLAAGLFETLGFVWISIGIAHAPVAIVSPFAGLSSAFTVAYAWLILGERPAPALLAGAALVCAGAVLLSL